MSSEKIKVAGVYRHRIRQMPEIISNSRKERNRKRNKETNKGTNKQIKKEGKQKQRKKQKHKQRKKERKKERDTHPLIVEERKTR